MAELNLAFLAVILWRFLDDSAVVTTDTRIDPHTKLHNEARKLNH